MLFSSSIFIFGFLPVVICVYYGLLTKDNRNARNIFLFVVSIFFYAWGEPKFVLIMLLSIIVNWRLGLLVDNYRSEKSTSRLIIIITVVFNLSLIFVFKYLMFSMNVLNAVTGLSLPVPEIFLPIGISFFTFQSMSYVIDVYRGNGEVQKSVLNVGLYIAFFPQLIAGPIVRYQTIADQINADRESWEDFSYGVCRFIAGLAKKVLISNQMAIIADEIFNSGSAPAATAWLGAIAYSLQIYYDFSGYSDMAIGLGRMFGFHFDENFDYPYISRSISEFWRRWHISLGTWFRDYVYFPLGGSRVKSKSRLFFNLFVVWFLTGVWHGAAWTFIFWGLYFFAFIAFEKLVLKDKIKKIPSVIAHLGTLLIVLFGWVMFRASGMTAAVKYLMDMFGLRASGIFDDTFYMFIREKWIYLIAAVIFSIPLKKIFESFIRRFVPKLNNKVTQAVYGVMYPCVMSAVFVICVAYLLKGTYNPFIYFNF